MVSRPQTIFISIICLLLSAFAHAETQLSTSIDRNKIYQNEVVNLTVQANTKLDFSRGGLMNFGGSNVEAPKFDNIDQNGEILDRQQSYNMQSINGNNQSLITWRYTLSPKHQGVLTIPSATYKDATSPTQTVEVLPGLRPRNAENPPTAFLTASIDKESPYLQEQVVYTLSLYTLGEARGDMPNPSSSDFIIEELGDTKTFKMAYNRRYEVYERTYLIFPQKSGELTLEAPVFNGTVVDPRTRRRARANEPGNSVTVSVKPPPTSFSGKTWLPATSLFISEKLDPDADTIVQGDSITRTLKISALGLLGSALPEVDVPNIPGLKVYPDQPVVEAEQHAQGVQSSRTETHALVAIQPGKVQLPEVSIKWWDVVNDIERESTIDARDLSITAAANAGSVTGSLDPNDTSADFVTIGPDCSRDMHPSILDRLKGSSSHEMRARRIPIVLSQKRKHGFLDDRGQRCRRVVIQVNLLHRTGSSPTGYGLLGFQSPCNRFGVDRNHFCIGDKIGS